MADVNLDAVRQLAATLEDVAYIEARGSSPESAAVIAALGDAVTVSVSTDAGNVLDVGTDDGVLLTLEGLGVSPVVSVVYDAGWPANRPTLPTGWIVLCVGDPGGAGPTWMLTNDVWTQG